RRASSVLSVQGGLSRQLQAIILISRQRLPSAPSSPDPPVPHADAPHRPRAVASRRRSNAAPPLWRSLWWPLLVLVSALPLYAVLLARPDSRVEGVSVVPLDGGPHAPRPAAAPSSPGDAPPSSRARQRFTYGMFEDANYVSGTSDFAATVADLKARHFDSILFTNNFTYRDEPLLRVADELEFGIVFAPHAELSAGWWPAAAPATLDHARTVIYPLVDHVRGHPSLMGYSVIDDAPKALASKITLATQAFRERDPDRPAGPVLVAGHDEVYRAARPDIALTYIYPALVVKPPCDFSRHDGARTLDAVTERLRQLAVLAEHRVPIWLILQAHGGTKEYDPAHPDGTALREPTVEEVRLQHWLALGEGVKGIFWFIYSTQQFWTGVRDNPVLRAELTDLAGRTAPLRGLLPSLRKGEDRVTVSGPADTPAPFRPYVSTLFDENGGVYVVAANRSCSPQQLTLRAPGVRGWLRDVEANRWYRLGTVLTFRGGDGKLFELVPDAGAISDRGLGR
ncbi:MAG: hypothetical protein M3442_06005, partial [Chloroflexota bacterium]|nr:hypothetical protein [Chloroflexota bacterium]